MYRQKFTSKGIKAGVGLHFMPLVDQTPHLLISVNDLSQYSKSIHLKFYHSHVLSCFVCRLSFQHFRVENLDLF